jgi:hypothetical protein
MDYALKSGPLGTFLKAMYAGEYCILGQLIATGIEER